MRALPPLTALRAFEAAARHLSFKGAANELRLTPTAISHQIRLLENTLGRPLFRRRPRPLALTPAGAALFPILRAGFDDFEHALTDIRQEAHPPKLRITTTNAFAARWLVPRLPLWRAAYPELVTEVIGTDAVIDLTGGEADIAVRYSFAPPSGLPSIELLRDRFWPVANPQLLAARRIHRPSDLARYPLVHAGWPLANTHAPTWQRWIKAARKVDAHVSSGMASGGLIFREELHAIDAVLGGQGVGLLSDVLVKEELDSGKLIRVSDVSLPGLGFYLIHIDNNSLKPKVDQFVAWMRSVC
jgi:LysR family transcriptional regulator, glycine cleavage system transcriptional activator